MDLHLSRKIALVTGASKGLGYETAKMLSQEGARVAINSRDPEKLQSSTNEISQHTNQPVLAVPGDVTDPEIPTRLIEKTVETFNGLDILITNSGGPAAGLFEDFNDEQWQQAFNLSFMSHVRLIRAALPYLKQSKCASVLTITSYSVKQPIPNLILSNSIRAATVGLTKTLALELGNQGIRFNSILPGWTLTDRINQLMTVRAQQNQTSIAEEIEKQASASPFSRLATPQEFAAAAVFLVSPVASYITGVMLSVDGGMYKGIL